jgi:hypothetical protein
MISTAAPSWTSAVRNGMSSGSPPTSQREEFFRLYERCIASGLHACLEIRNGTGFQEISLSCRLQSTPIAIVAPRARRRQHRRHGSEYPLPEHSPVSSLTPTRAKSLTAQHKQAVPEHPLPKSLWPELAIFLSEPLATASQTDKEGGEEAVRGGATEGWWGGGGSFPLPSQHHTPLPSSDATATDPNTSTIADPAIAVAALAIGSAFADPDIAVAGAALAIGIDKKGVMTRFVDNLPTRRFVTTTIKRTKASLSQEEVQKFFDNFRKSAEGVTPEIMYNFDETNLHHDSGSKRCLFKRGTKYCEKVQNDSKQAMSMMCCGSGAGEWVPPMVIYKAQNLYTSWCKRGPKGAVYAYSKSGWFDMYLSEMWFVDLLLPRLEIRPGKKLLIGNNLASHISPKVIYLCKANNFAFVCLPPNLTNKLQPLDVGVFGPLKAAWRRILTNFKAGVFVHNVR